MRIVGIDMTKAKDVHTQDELRLILTESEEGGAIKNLRA